MKLPNILTIARLLLIPIIAFLLYSNKPNYILISTILFFFAALSDWADGIIARRFNQKSNFGILFDPLADKMLILTILLVFVDLKIIPLWVILVLLFRELLVTGIRQVCSTKDEVVGANWMGKTKFIMQSAVIIYLHIVLYFMLLGQKNHIFNKVVAYYIIVLLTAISLLFALNFLFWHRKKILSNI